jgi:para-nitrobenzyl esterase
MFFWDMLTATRPHKGEAVEVQTRSGTVRGLRRESSGVFAFRGIPYAAQPQRFKRAQPHPGWVGVLDCVNFGKIAVQGKSRVARREFPTLLRVSGVS